MASLRALVTLLAAAFALVAWPARAHAFTPPPLPPGQYVVDTAGKLSPGDVQDIDARLGAIRRAGGPWIAVLVTRSLDGEPIDDVGIATGRAWQIGEKGQDNGVVIVIAPNDRKVRVEVGKHLEGDLTDLQSNDIIRKVIGPRLREGDFRGGIEDGAEAIARTVMHGDLNLPQRAPRARGPQQQQPGSALGLLAFGLPIAIVILVAILNARRARRYGGGGGGWWWWGGGGGGWGGGGGFGGGDGGGFGGGDSGPSGGGDFGGGGSSDSY